MPLSTCFKFVLGFFASIYNFFVGESSGDEISVEELKKVPANLHTAINQLCQIFSVVI